MTVTVAEVFGPTIQGEGPSMGRRCGFVRLGRCNLDCGSGPGATWACDTPYTWDWSGKLGRAFVPSEELQPLEVPAILERVAAMGVDRVVVTGGEPLVQRELAVLVARLHHDLGMVVEVETNGTLVPSGALVANVERFNVSPKLANSGVAVERRIVPEALAAFRVSGKAAFKFVCGTSADMDEVAALVEDHRLPAAAVWIMAAGTDPNVVGSLTRLLADEVVARGWNLTTRLHVLTWGDRRGR